MKRVKLTFDEKQLNDVEQLAKKLYPFLPLATALKIIVLNIARNERLIWEVGTASHLEAPQVTTPRYSLDKDQDSPDPARARKNINININKNKKENNTKLTNPEKCKRLSPVETSKVILSDLNQRAGTNYQAKGKRARQLIALRMAEGYTVEDFFEVHRKKCKEWLGTNMERYLTYETLYGTKFSQYLGQKEVGPKIDRPLTEGELRAQRWERMKDPDYYSSGGQVELA